MPSLAVCSMTTRTRWTPETRSIAPPMPLTILPGIIQLARSPCSDLHRSQDREINVAAADHREGIRAGEEAGACDGGDGLLARVDEVGVSSPSNGKGPRPSMPFSLWRTTSIPSGM